jgi:DNA primase
VLRNSEAWGLFSHEDHHLLCELPAPVGDLFSWIDSRFHDHGGEPWAVLQLGVEGQPFAELANRLIGLDNMQPHGRAIDVEDVPDGDLKKAMNGIHLDAVAEELARVTKLPQTDPGKMERLYELTRRQKALLDQQKPAPKP